MTDELWQPLWLSLRIASVATVLAVLLGTPLAYAMARRSFPGRTLVEAFILLPLVLPPTVVGYLILMALGRHGWLLSWLGDSFNYSIVFKFEGAVLSAMIVAIPMLYMPAKGAFGAVDPDLEDSAKIMGANRLQVFWHVAIPLARRGLVSGLLLAFARALGEFGATMMVYGWQPEKVTLPVSIYRAYEERNMPLARDCVIVLSVMSLVLVLAYNVTLGARKSWFNFTVMRPSL